MIFNVLTVWYENLLGMVYTFVIFVDIWVVSKLVIYARGHFYSLGMYMLGDLECFHQAIQGCILLPNVSSYSPNTVRGIIDMRIFDAMSFCGVWCLCSVRFLFCMWPLCNMMFPFYIWLFKIHGRGKLDSKYVLCYCLKIFYFYSDNLAGCNGFLIVGSLH